VFYRNKTSDAGKDTKEERTMTVARVTELSSYSTESFEDAIEKGIERAHKTLRNVKSAWVKEQEVRVGEDGKIEAYQVNMLVTFVLED
jgi:flavin-binding protein dodecin